MPQRFGRRKELEFDDALERILLVMNEEEVGSEEYKKAIIYLDRVSDIKVKLKPAKVRLTRDTILIVAGGLVQVGLIVFAEQNHVVVSKALSFIMKPKTRDISI